MKNNIEDTDILAVFLPRELLHKICIAYRDQFEGTPCYKHLHTVLNNTQEASYFAMLRTLQDICFIGDSTQH